jgi:hypothetical protein
MKNDETTEGPRGFGVLLQHIDDGGLHTELSEAVQKLTTDLTDQVEAMGQDAKGTITIVLSLAARRNGTVDVGADVKVKTPKPKRANTLFWATKGGNLTAENPRQGRLPLREVEALAAPITIEAPSRKGRSV